jgi:hypothetical protein
MDGPVSTATSYGLDGRGSVHRKVNISLLSIAFRRVLGPTQPPIQWVLEVISAGVKQPGHEADHSPPSSAEVKNYGTVPSVPHLSSLHSA